MLGSNDFVVASQFLQALPAVELANEPTPWIKTLPAKIAMTKSAITRITTLWIDTSPRLRFAGVNWLSGLLLFVGYTPTYAQSE